VSADSEDQMIEISDLLKEVLNVALIGEIERVPFCFSIERCECVFNLARVTRRDDCSRASCHRLLGHCLPDAGRPAEHYNSFLAKLPWDSQFVAFASLHFPFPWLTSVATPQ